MSKIYNKYFELKESDNDTLCMFKCGMFYIFLDEDAKKISNELNLKLTKFNDTIVKCGFPLGSLSKYTEILNTKNINFKIIDSNNVNVSTKQYIEYQNIQNQLDSIKKIDINKLTPLKAFEIVSNLHSALRRFKVKRKQNLYQDTYKLENIMQAFDEVCKNTKNKNRVNKYKEFKCMYIYRVYIILKNKQYVVGPYNVFTIYEPKERRIVSQNMHDKIINHLISRYILHPAILPCLIDANVASRENLGTSKGLSYFYDFQRKCKMLYGKYYILKCDISKYFASINHYILKKKLSRRIKDKDALKIVFDIIDSDESGLSIR